MRICVLLVRLRGKTYGATGIASSGNIRPPFFLRGFARVTFSIAVIRHSSTCRVSYARQGPQTFAGLSIE
ncbi:MAG: hypothetical protein JWR22_4277 [Herminiimonas sp.]|nr:hypothetical protein [Herminiimonas sp.]